MKIHTVSGYEEVGKNMTAVEVGGDLVLIDMGADMETVIEQEEELEQLNTPESIASGAVPDDGVIKDRRDDVVAIIIGHGHLDHCLALPKLANAYSCPIYATPFTAKVVKRLIKEDSESVTNPVEVRELGSRTNITDDIELEFVNITHSIPHTPLTVLHTPEGAVAYSLDFKLDDAPTLGKKPDYDRITALGEEGVHVYIADSTRTDQAGRTKSEAEIQIELQNLIDKAYRADEGVIITTFSSHIARLNEILDANDGRRKVAFVGRSLKEYTKSAAELDLIDLDNVEVVSWHNEVEDLLRRASQEKGEWLIVCTGNQGEPNSALARIARGEYHYDLAENDRVIFSSTVIPTPVNEANRYKLEKELQDRDVQIEIDVHAHGHGMREDQREMIQMLQPKHIVPAHGGTEKLSSNAALAMEEGYTLEETVHISQNGRTLTLE